MHAAETTMTKSGEEILYMGFNQDGSCLAVGRRRGFDIFSAETASLLHREDCGTVRLVEMLFRTSLVALVGKPGDDSHLAGCRQLTMWNTKSRSGICQLQFPSEICGVKMNHRRAVVLLRQKVHIFDLKTMRGLHVIDRSDTAPGLDPALGSLCCDPERGLLAAPLVAGTQGAAPEARAGLVGVVDTHTLQPLGAVLAHRSPVRAMCFNSTGQLLATASARGTVVRLWAVPSLTLLCSFRRGANECCIHGIGFSPDSLHLMAAAATGAVHVFRCPKEALDCLGPSSLKPAAASTRPATRERSSSADAEEDEDDLSEWNIVECDRSGRLQSKVEGSGLQGHVTKVKSILTQLLQPCRDYLDGPSAVAWVHLGPEESNAVASGPPRSPTLGPLALPAATLPELEGPVQFVACLVPHPSAGSDGGCLVVGSRRGMLSTFDWRRGEGLLAVRQALEACASTAPAPSPAVAPERQKTLRPPPTGVAALKTPPIRPMPSPLIVEASKQASDPDMAESLSLGPSAYDVAMNSTADASRADDTQRAPVVAVLSSSKRERSKRSKRSKRAPFTAPPTVEEKDEEEAVEKEAHECAEDEVTATKASEEEKSEERAPEEDEPRSENELEGVIEGKSPAEEEEMEEEVEDAHSANEDETEERTVDAAVEDAENAQTMKGDEEEAADEEDDAQTANEDEEDDTKESKAIEEEREEEEAEAEEEEDEKEETKQEIDDEEGEGEEETKQGTADEDEDEARSESKCEEEGEEEEREEAEDEEEAQAAKESDREEAKGEIEAEDDMAPPDDEEQRDEIETEVDLRCHPQRRKDGQSGIGENEAALESGSRKAKRAARQAAREERKAVVASVRQGDSDEDLLRRRKGKKGRRRQFDDFDAFEPRRPTPSEEPGEEATPSSASTSVVASPSASPVLTATSAEERIEDADLEEAEGSPQEASAAEPEDAKRAKRAAKKAAQRAAALAPRAAGGEQGSDAEVEEARGARGRKAKGRRGPELDRSEALQPALGELEQQDDCSASWSKPGGRGKRRQARCTGRGRVL